jgi:kinetochor protein Mis14/NSL1
VSFLSFSWIWGCDWGCGGFGGLADTFLLGTEIEPFDAKLAQRVQSLSAQIENQTLQLASLRRDAPGATARKFEEEFKRRSEEDEARVKKQEEMDAEAARELKLDVGDVERLGEVQGTWQRGTEELEELKARVGGTVARMERAKRAVEFVEGSG